MSRIVVVEDDADLNNLVARALRQNGHEILQVFDGEAAVRQIEAAPPDLVILDWMLPKLDGLAVCRRVRQRHLVPILMLTARAEEADLIMGLEVGADDYLTKPFRIRELLARVHALLRRTQVVPGEPALSSATIHAGEIDIDPSARTVRVEGSQVELTRKEFDLLALMAGHPGRVFSREYLVGRFWSGEYDVTERTVDTHVQRLRKKLGSHASAIQTVWGIGYKLGAEAQR